MKNREIFHKSLKGSTLVEVLVAMVIITSVFAIGGIIYLNVMRYTLNNDEIIAKTLAEDALQTKKEGKKYHLPDLDKVFEVKINEEAYSGGEDLYLISVGVFNHKERLVYQTQELIYRHEE